MRNGKKWLALTAALCMALPSMTAFAGEAKSVGTGAVEVDPQEVAPYYHVVLPTINAGTFDFILDPGKELIKYDAVTYAADKTAYFTQAVAATLSNPESSTSDGALYVEKYEEVGAASVAGELKAEYVNGGGVAKKGDARYYLWVPDTSNLPEGKYVELTADNVLDYCTAKNAGGDVLVKDDDGTITSGIDSLVLNTMFNSGTHVFDGKLYKMDYEQLAGTYDIDDYVTIDATTKAVTIETDNKALYYKKTSDSKYYKIETADVATYVKITEATTTKADKSDKVTIVNKSSADTEVTATVTVKDAGTLKFISAAPSAGSADASVYLTIGGKNGNPLTAMTPVAVVPDAADATKIEGEVTFTLAGLSDVSKYNTYQGDVIQATGGHEYVRYNMPEMTYSTAELEIAIEANGDTAAKPAWKAYNKALQDAYVANGNVAQKPQIEVVYTLQNDVDDELNAPVLPQVNKTGNWTNEGLWFNLDGNSIDTSKLVSIEVLQTDGTTYATANKSILIVGTADDSYARITWASLVTDSGADSNNIKFKVTYDGKVYIVTPAAS